MIHRAVIGACMVTGVLLAAAAGCDAPEYAHTGEREGRYGYPVELRYETPDGWTIHATLSLSPRARRPLLIDIHMLQADRTYYPVRRETLEFCSVLVIDMRGHGDSLSYRGQTRSWETNEGNMYWGSFDDIRGGIRSVEKDHGAWVDTGKIFLEGNSYSCVLILQYFLAHPEGVRGLILMSPGDSYGQSVTQAYSTLLSSASPAPVFQVCSTGDYYCNNPVAVMENIWRTRMAAGASGALPLMKFVMEEGRVHGTHFLYTHRHRYPGTIIAWMKRVLGEPD
ncbi:MAG: alpha/beta hydrolase [Spirochaetes bacterium]|nr:MAG: alpha/beta hydrolase [Spirochaetota bacterium]